VKGRAEGVWRYTRRGQRLDISVSPFRKVTATVKRQVRGLAEKVATHFDATLDGLEWT
jgi:hypothetical protein